ncbi:MerR family transcriptional regulator [Deinococcus sp.]|uniref:MerR family transcriptional regulator n=1 Tax=Deinococcus sp. TaxID=47478 RepID=UPI003CC566F2
MAGVSIRTLHHYDDLGLLRPSGRSEGNYRVYAQSDLERLHAVLIYRELGFALADIRALLDDPDHDSIQSLKTQRQLLLERQQRNAAMLAALDTLLAAAQGETPMTKQEMKELFGGFDPGEYEQEVQQRWGDTDAYKQSMARTKSYTKADWQQIKAEADGISQQFVALMDAGVSPESVQAQAVAAQHRAHLERWFYDCPPAMYAGLSELWVNDPRFTKNIDKARSGLAAYQRAAVQAWVGGL